MVPNSRSPIRNTNVAERFITRDAGCVSRLVITVKDLGYTGYEAERILRMRYNVQVELADLFNVVALLSIGDTQTSVNKLVDAVRELAREDRPIDIYSPTGVLERRLKKGSYRIPPIPELVVTPREAFLSDYVEVPFTKSAARVCVEVVTPYPPGIPILCPGERITQDTIEYLRLELKAGVHIQGPVDKKVGTIRVLP